MKNRSALALVALCTFITGCGAGEPSNLESPDVVWPDAAPTTEFDDSPYVQAYRNALYEVAIAWNNLDYSDADLIRHGGYDSAIYYADRAQGLFRGDYYFRFELDRGGDPAIYLVPDPATIIPTDVVPQGENSAYVEYCILPQSKAYERLVNSGRVLVTLYDDGSSTIKGAYLDSDDNQKLFDYCKTLDIPLAKFDPAPTPITSPTPGSVRPPLPARAYDFESSNDS